MRMPVTGGGGRFPRRFRRSLARWVLALRHAARNASPAGGGSGFTSGTGLPLTPGFRDTRLVRRDFPAREVRRAGLAGRSAAERAPHGLDSHAPLRPARPGLGPRPPPPSPPARKRSPPATPPPHQ